MARASKKGSVSESWEVVCEEETEEKERKKGMGEGEEGRGGQEPAA